MRAGSVLAVLAAAVITAFALVTPAEGATSSYLISHTGDPHGAVCLNAGVGANPSVRLSFTCKTRWDL